MYDERLEQRGKPLSEERRGKIPLKRLVIWFVRFCVFMVIWCGGCALADYKFNFDSNAYTMWWGYTVGAVGLLISGLWGRPSW